MKDGFTQDSLRHFSPGYLRIACRVEQVEAFLTRALP